METTVMTTEAILNFNSKSVKVKVHGGAKLESIKSLVFGHPWNEAHMEDGSITYFQFFCYEDSFDFRNDVDLEAYKKANAAFLELLSAYEKYRNSMAKLNAIKKEEGNYEDYRSWLEIPEVPNFKWADI